MKATNDFIIVKNTMMEEQTRESGLVIKRANKDAENNGVIESIGESVTNKELKVGDTVEITNIYGDKYIYKVYEINLQYIPIIFAKSEIFVNILKKGFKILD